MTGFEEDISSLFLVHGHSLCVEILFSVRD